MGVFQHWPNRITALRFVGAAALFVVLAQWCDVPRGQVAERRGAIELGFWLFIAVALDTLGPAAS